MGGGIEIGLLLFLAFLIFGPKKLPEIARMLGKGMGELRRASSELTRSLEEEIRNLDRPSPDVKPDSVSPYAHNPTEPTRDTPEPRT